MVENTIENKRGSKGGSSFSKTLLLIAVGIFISLVFSVYLRINNVNQLFNYGNVTIPKINEIDSGLSGLGDIMKQAQGQTNSNSGIYTTYTTPDGYLSIKYPASFADGRSVIEDLTGKDLSSTNYLLYAYRMNQSSSDMQPTTLIAARYDATSTEDVIAQIKEALNQQKCRSDIKELETVNENTIYRIFDSTYKCGDQGDLSLWQARIAVIKKNDSEYYTITGAAVSKDWESAKLEINSILETISINQPVPETEAVPEEPGAINKNNQPQNNETEN